jgi:hypothetical protein
MINQISSSRCSSTHVFQDVKTPADDYRLEGPVVTVIVGSGPSKPSYNLPVALLSFHSHFFRKEILRLESAQARIGGNKKRKVSREDSDTVVEVKKEDGESEIEDVEGHKIDVGEMVIKLPDVEPMVFGLFLKYMYTGFYPATVDAQSGGTYRLPHASTPVHHISPYTPAKAAMPPPANINHLPNGRIPPSTYPTPKDSTPQQPSTHTPIPPSIHAHLLSLRLAAPDFTNHTTSHIFHGIGKHFALTPNLVHYIWSHTNTFPASSLQKLILDVLVVHWPSTSSRIVAKQPVWRREWDEVFDEFRELRCAVMVGLQGGVVVQGVQAYFVGVEEGLGERGGEVVQGGGVDGGTKAAEAVVVVAREQGTREVAGKE